MNYQQAKEEILRIAKQFGAYAAPSGYGKNSKGLKSIRLQAYWCDVYGVRCSEIYEPMVDRLQDEVDMGITVKLLEPFKGGAWATAREIWNKHLIDRDRVLTREEYQKAIDTGIATIPNIYAALDDRRKLEQEQYWVRSAWERKVREKGARMLWMVRVTLPKHLSL